MDLQSTGSSIGKKIEDAFIKADYIVYKGSSKKEVVEENKETTVVEETVNEEVETKEVIQTTLDDFIKDFKL